MHLIHQPALAQQSVTIIIGSAFGHPAVVGNTWNAMVMTIWVVASDRLRAISWVTDKICQVRRWPLVLLCVYLEISLRAETESGTVRPSLCLQLCTQRKGIVLHRRC